jgi:hypothetical protein
MGTIKTTNIEPIADNGTVTLGSSGDTFTLGSGVKQSNMLYPAFYAYLGSSQTGLSDNTAAKITIDTEVLDTDNCFASNKFTPTTAGKYFLYASVNLDAVDATNWRNGQVYIYKNGSSIINGDFNLVENMGRRVSPYVSVVVDANGSSDYFELYAEVDTNNSGNWQATGYTSSQIRTYFGGYRIGS